MNAASSFKGKKILVTGGAGSIGSVIVKHLLAQGAAVVRVLSRDEGKHHLLREAWDNPEAVRWLVGDIRDRFRLARAMEDCDTVFHAAALKHVPSCEYNPFEASQTNIMGTQNVIEAALDAGVKQLLMISTDKAVNPVNTMGASKLVAERIAIASNVSSASMKVSCVRFGNVLGARGSLVPLVVERIRQQRAVPLTDPEMTRFMMSLDQAVDLCLQAAGRCQGGEVFCLKMPALSVKRFIEVLTDEVKTHLGLESNNTVIETIGARAGEKTHEELFSQEENMRATQQADMVVIHPLWRLPPQAEPVSEALRSSQHATLLDDEQIRTLIRDSGCLALSS